MIDVTFKTYSDAGGRDPDAHGKTLKLYHKLLWSKSLPKGKYFQLSDLHPNAYLYHESELGTFYLGSDAITHSYRNQRRKQTLIAQVTEEANELFEIGSTIGAYLIFPNKQIDRKPTINQARGVNAYIDDRFDLTLECIKRFYLKTKSPLTETLNRYADFFDLFIDFEGYVNFFLLNDLIKNDQDVNFYLPFDDFNSQPRLNSVNDYLHYKNGVKSFVYARNERIMHALT